MRPHRPTHRPRSPFYAELMAYVHAPTTPAHDQLARVLDALIEVLHAKRMTDLLIQARSARRAMAAVLQRHERTGVLAVSHLDALTLRTAAPYIETAISRMRLDVFNLATALVDARMRAQGVSATA